MKIGKNAPKTDSFAPLEDRQPRLLDAAQLAAKDEAVAALIAAAPSQVEAWEALGPRTKTQHEMARDARVFLLEASLRERWAAVLRGRALVEQNGLQPGYAERFLELHTQRLELRWRLEACVFPHAGENRDRLARLADEEVSDALGGVWPNEAVQEWMSLINTLATCNTEPEAMKDACRAAVAAACAQKYPATDNTTETEND